MNLSFLQNLRIQNLCFLLFLLSTSFSNQWKPSVLNSVAPCSTLRPSATSCHFMATRLKHGLNRLREAFYSVLHGWILRIIHIFELSPTIINFLQHNLGLWKISLRLTHANGTTKAENLRIECGIFQANSLSPLLLLFN